MLESLWVKPAKCGFDCHGADLLHPWVDMLVKVYFLLRVHIIQISLQIAVGQLIALLVFTIFTSVLLNGIISQMDNGIREIFETELFRGRSNVSF